MKIIIVLLLALTGAYALPLNGNDTPTINTTAIKSISDAIVYAIYVGQQSSDIVDHLDKDESHPSICFIKPRDPNSTTPPLDRLKEDREWLESFYNYTTKVNRDQCQDLRPLSEDKRHICIDVINMLDNMDKLKTLLDQIIGNKKEIAGDGVNTETFETNCWDTTPVQQYWNFLELHSLSQLYIKQDLEDLQKTFTHEK